MTIEPVDDGCVGRLSSTAGGPSHLPPTAVIVCSDLMLPATSLGLPERSNVRSR